MSGFGARAHAEVLIDLIAIICSTHGFRGLGVPHYRAGPEDCSKEIDEVFPDAVNMFWDEIIFDRTMIRCHVQ